MMARQRSRWTRWECAKQGLTYYHVVQDEADKTLCGQRIAKQAREGAADGPKTKAADLNFAFVTYFVSEWIRARHCDRRGVLDKKTS